MTLLVGIGALTAIIHAGASDALSQGWLPHGKGRLAKVERSVYVAVPARVTRKMISMEKPIYVTCQVRKDFPAVKVEVMLLTPGGKLLNQKEFTAATGPTSPILLGYWSKVKSAGIYPIIFKLTKSQKIPAARVFARFSVRSTQANVIVVWNVNPSSGSVFIISYKIGGTCRLILQSMGTSTKTNQEIVAWEQDEMTRTQGDSITRKWKWDKNKTRSGMHRIIWTAYDVNKHFVLQQEFDSVIANK